MTNFSHLFLICSTKFLNFFRFNQGYIKGDINLMKKFFKMVEVQGFYLNLESNINGL